MSWRPFKVHHLVATAGLFAVLTCCGPSWTQTPTDRADIDRDGQIRPDPTDAPAQESPNYDIQSANLNPTGNPDKAAILKSLEWQYVMQSLRGWLSVQMIYTDEEVDHLQRDFGSRVAGMTAVELQALRGELKSKLDVLLSREALEASNWMARQMSVLSEKRAEELRAGLPDVANMTPEQMEAALVGFRAERSVATRNAQANQLAAQQRNAAARNLARQQSSQSARSQPSRAATFGHQPPPPRRQGWVPAQRYEAANPSQSLHYLNRARSFRW